MQEFKAQEYGSSLLADLGEELGELGEELLGVSTPCTAADDLRILVDHSELRQQELLHQSEARQAKLLQRVRELDQEAEGLRNEVRELQGKLLAHNQEAVTANLNNMDLLSKLDSQVPNVCLLLGHGPLLIHFCCVAPSIVFHVTKEKCQK